MQKFSPFYVTYQNIVQYDHDLWKLDDFEKSVLELMTDPAYYKESHDLQNLFLALVLVFMGGEADLHIF